MRTAGGSRLTRRGAAVCEVPTRGACDPAIRPLSLSNRTALRRVEPFGRWDGVTH